MRQCLRIDCISDLHGDYPKLEGGDLLIVAGDLTASDAYSEYIKFLSWLHKQKYKHYIFIGGNHDNLLQQKRLITESLHKTSYLCDSGTELEGVKIWGSPWTPTHPDIKPHCAAFTGTEEELEAKFRLIPDDIDILITHGPPYGMLDLMVRSEERGGSEALLRALRRVRPKLHVFGHIHEGYGQYRPNLGFIDCPGYPIYVNCSHVNEEYEPVNKAIRVEL